MANEFGTWEWGSCIIQCRECVTGRPSAATPQMQWLGMWPSDITAFSLPNSVQQPLSDNDRQCLESLQRHPLVKVWLHARCPMR